MKISAKCKICNKMDEFEAPLSGFEMRRRGRSWEEAFPDMPAERIVQMTTNVCPNCQTIDSPKDIIP